jgi:hypothetical protein
MEQLGHDHCGSLNKDEGCQQQSQQKNLITMGKAPHLYNQVDLPRLGNSNSNRVNAASVVRHMTIVEFIRTAFLACLSMSVTLQATSSTTR